MSSSGHRHFGLATVYRSLARWHCPQSTNMQSVNCKHKGPTNAGKTPIRQIDQSENLISTMRGKTDKLTGEKTISYRRKDYKLQAKRQ